jgi:hypothetical protein
LQFWQTWTQLRILPGNDLRNRLVNDLAALYKKQLLDIRKEEYLTRKRKDRESQQKLQEALGE